MRRDNFKKATAFALAIVFVCGLFYCAVSGDTNADEASSVQTAQTEQSGYKTDRVSAPEVFFTSDISPEGLVKIYEKTGFEPTGNVAVKMSTGEPPASNYLRPELIGDLVRRVDGTIVECNTAYGGSRASSAAHWQVIKDHGLDAINEKGADIMDEEDSMEIPAPRGTTINKDYVGSHLANYDCLISLAHFKGHAMAGFGGAIKNMSIGVASSKGKAWIHSGGTSTTDVWGGEQDKFLEAMGDATSGVVDYLDGKVVYINVMNRLSVDCDCDGNPAEPDMHDIGILASTDPVALDQACIDLVYAQKDGDGRSLVERIESRNGLHTLEHAEAIGLGSRSYRLTDIDGSSATASEEVTEPISDADTSYDVRVTIGSNKVTVGENSYEIDAAPYIQQSSQSTLVPLRFVAVALGGGNADSMDNSDIVSWSPETRTASVATDDGKVEFTADSNTMLVNGESKPMPNGAAAELKDGRMYIPFRALGEALGVSVDWEQASSTAIYHK